MDVQFSEILHNEHLQNIALVIRAGWPKKWRDEHPHVPYWNLTDKLKRVATAEFFESNRREIVNRFFDLFNAIIEADPRIRVETDDLDWFIRTMDQPHGLAVLWLLLAWASATPDYLTPQEIADASGTHESTWRNKAAAGGIPGAVKRGGEKGRLWLIPREAVRDILPNEHDAPTD